MAITKFRDVSTVGPVPARESKAENIRAALDLSELAFRLSRQTSDRGIRRYRSIADPTRSDPHNR